MNSRKRIFVAFVLCAMLLPLYPSNVGSDSIFVSASYEPKQALFFMENGLGMKVWIEEGRIRYLIGEEEFYYRFGEHAASLLPIHLPGKFGLVWEDATSRSIKSYITWFEGKEFGEPVWIGYSRPAVLSADGRIIAATIGNLGEVWLTIYTEESQPTMFSLGIQGRNVSLAYYNGAFYIGVSGKTDIGKGVHIYQSKDGKFWEKIRYWETEFLPTNLSFRVDYGLWLNWSEDKGDHILNASGKVDNGEITLRVVNKHEEHPKNEKPVPPLPLPMKNWTLVVFLDGDNNLASYGRDDVNEMETVGSQDWMNIVVLFDGASNGDSCLYYVEQDNNTATITSPKIPLSQVNTSWGNELNMGSVNTVVDFAKFVFENFPAKYTFFDFWNHGASWTGHCWDDTNGDNQEMFEFRQELDMLRNLTGRKVLWDIWTGDECLMASEAVTYQAKAFTNYTINSEDSISADGWPYDKIFKWPKNYPNMTVVEFAYHAWNEYVTEYANSRYGTLSVINNTLFDYEVVPLANNLAQKLRHRAGDFKSKIETARSNAQGFEIGSGYGFDRDFYHFVDLLIGQIPQTSDPEIYAAAVALRDALTPNPSKAVMWEGHNSYTPNAHGLKCYIGTSYSTEFDTLMYSKETSWDEFLRAFIAGTNVPNVEPHVSITFPTEGSVVYQTGLLTVTGTANDNGDSGTVQYVQVKIDREDWKNATGTTSWSYSVDATKLEPGQHRIFARSYDGKDYSLFASVNITVTANPNLPDLTVTTISVSNSSPTEGQTITINATIANVGTNWSATNVNVGFYVNSVASAPFSIVNLGDIAAGNSKIASTTFDTTGYAGICTIYVVADPFNAIPELTDLNNTGSISVTVIGYNFELACSQNTSFVATGGSHIYPITVKNTGTITDTIQLTINNPTNWSANFNDNKVISGTQKLRTVNGYHTYAEVTSILQGIASNHSSIAKLWSIGTSWEGRNIWCLKISDNVNVNETSEPDIAFFGLHHAREWISGEVPLYIAQYLVDNYNVDPRATYFVNHREIYIIPIVNPDGLEYCQQGHDWRKNRRNNGDGTYGVDLNRNYNGSQNGDANGAWGGAGSSHTTSSEIYCGPSAFSEPETQAIRNFVTSLRDQNNQLAISISYHSYGEVVYYPWGYARSPEHGGSPVVTAPDVTYLKKIAQEIASRITSQSGSGTYDAMQSGDSYLTTGDTDDWIYGYSKYVWGKPTFPFTIELATSFQPPAASITQICRANLEGALYAIWRAGDIYFDAPTIQHTPLQNTSHTVNGYIVNASITSNLTLASVKLYWKTTGSFNEVLMSTTDGKNYTGTIPAQPLGTTVYYYLEAKNANTTSTLPQYAPEQLYSFSVRNEQLTYNVTLLPNESRIVNLTVTAPTSAQPLEMANITVVGVSQGNNTKVRTVLTQTQVKPQLLLVDDTSGSYLSHYTNILNSLSLTYDTTTSANALSILRNYQTVLWICKGSTTLSSSEKTALASFLDGGGRLFISGEDIGYDIASDPDKFYQNYLHATYISDDANTNYLDGISRDPVSEGFTKIAISGYYPDVIAPADAYASLSFYYHGTTSPAALRVDTGTYKVYYLACEYFEGSDTPINKNEIMRRILTWLNVQHDIGIADLLPHNGSTQSFGVGEISAVVRNYGMQTCGSGLLSFAIYSYNATKTELLNETFENGTTRWTLQSPWGLTTTAHTGTYSLTDSPSGNYQNSVNISATYNNFISIPAGAQIVNFSFWHKYNFENNYDYGYVEVSTDGSTWQLLGKYTGNLTSWTMACFDLSSYAGQSIKLRFRFYSDYSINYDGWYIDDISIVAISLNSETYLETRNFTLPTITSGSSITQGFTMPFTASAYKVVATVSTCTDEFLYNNQKTTIFFVETNQFTVQLKKGLNFITLPVSGEKNLSEVLAQINGKYNIVWYFSPATNKWLKYVPWQSINTLTTINSTMAIAINVTINCALTLSEFQITSNTTLYLKQGWNMVGINLNKSITAGQLLSLLPSSSAIETFDTGTPYALQPTSILLPGKGYWIYVPVDLTVPL